MSAYTSTLDDTSFRLATVELVYGVENNKNKPQIPSVTLTTYQISDATTPRYNALSYTWGPPRRNAPRICVKTNLYDALLHLCQYCPGKPVWIDALCINQSNMAERQPQVSIMNKIYNGASTVLIWLGKLSAKLQLGLEIVDRVGELATREAQRIISNQRYDLSLSLGDMKRNYGLEPLTLDEADGLITLFESYWFSRVWVIQEVALAKEVGVFYGDGILSYDKIGATATFLHLTGLSVAIITAVTLARGDNSVDALDEVHIYQAERIQLLREWCRGGRSNWLEVLPLIDFSAGIEDGQLISRPGKDGSAGLILLKLLLWTIGFRATDQRDVVCGLWGILQHMANAQGVDMPKHLRPNYDISAAKLLERVAREILETSGTLMLLTLVKGPSRRKTPGLPSWCPDFSPILDSHPLCGPKFKSVAKVNAGGLELIGGSSTEIKDAKVEGWIKILSRMGQVYPPTGQSSLEAFWRTLIHDDFSSRPAQSPQSENFRDVVLMLMFKRLNRVFGAGGIEAVTELIQSWKDIDLDGLAERYPNHIYGTSFLRSCCRRVGLLPETETERLLPPEESAVWTQSRRASAAVFELLLGGTLFFRRIALTSGGHLAHASESISAGDEVWIVSGCPSPLVLRRLGSERGRYCLISEGYVHGVMNGEVATNDVKWQDITLV
ncbi:HET domain-containing protein [Fusarium sp. LHS14.1]|nr:HET domain-containing protein [Fusarium sp. LHS14.1]